MRRYKKIGRILLLTILLLCSTACNKNSRSGITEDFIKILIDPEVKDINTSIKLRLDPFENNSLRIGNMIYLEAVNQSSNDIYFPANSNIQIFRFDHAAQNWTVIKNSVNYYGEGYTTVPKGKEGLQSGSVTFRPVIENSATEEIRVVVTGIFAKNGRVTNEPVSAYIDLKLNP